MKIVGFRNYNSKFFIAGYRYKKKMHMNEVVYLWLSVLELTKTLTYEIRYDYANPKCSEQANLSHMDTISFTVYIKTDNNIYIIKAMQKIVKQGLTFQIMSWTDQNREERTKKVIGVMKEELGGKITKKVVRLRAKTFYY